MRTLATETTPGHEPGTPILTVRDRLRNYFEGCRHLRRGVCYLNAGQFDRAADAFTQASLANPDGHEPGDLLLSALIGAKRYGEAVEQVADEIESGDDSVTKNIQLALVEWKAHHPEDAIRTLRQAVADHPESAELHYQLGTMLSALNELEEAELRFTQVLAIDRTHTEGLVSLALCLGARQELPAAVEHLERAQNNSPHNARINLLLATASQAAQEAGLRLAPRAEMPDLEPRVAAADIDRIARVLETDQEFVEAFIGIDGEELDRGVFDVLALTLKRAIERNPHRANLYYYSSRVLELLGRADEAIADAERAVDIDPRYTQALVLLAELYQQTDRKIDAAARLEEALRLGVEYADTYFLLGNLYRDAGQIERARWAYKNALRINNAYEAAQEALASLAA